MPTVTEVLCLNFVNTVDSWHRPERVDRLVDYSALIGWAAHAGAASKSQAQRLLRLGRARAPEASHVHYRAVSLRQAIYEILAPGPRSQAHPAWLGVLNQELQRAMAAMTLEPAGTGYRLTHEVTDQLDQVLWPVARSAMELALSPALEKVHSCEGDDCGWLFLDTSKTGRRRWCSMAICGNRAKIKRHRERTRQS